MRNLNTALTGKRVYNGAGMAPNRGQVSARGSQGYLQRELRNKTKFNGQRLGGRPMAQPKGADGQSDNRSGVAAMALQRKTLGGLGGGPGTGLNPNGGGMLGQNPMGTGTGTKGTVAPGFQNPAMGQPQQPQVQVNDAGLLELPYNQAFGQAQYDALADANAQLLEMNTEQGDQQLQYTQGKRDAQQAYDQQRLGTVNENAAGGTAFSSKYGNAVVQNAGAFANTMGDIEAGNSRFQQDMTSRRAAIQSALNEQLSRAVQEYAAELGEQAGGLGYGTAGQDQGRKGIQMGKDKRKAKRAENKNGNKNKNKGSNRNSSIVGRPRAGQPSNGFSPNILLQKMLQGG